MRTKTKILAAALCALSSPASAQATRTPPLGSAERRDVLDALRPSVEARFRVTVRFVPRELCVHGDWALVIADARRPDGGEVPWRNYMSREEHDVGGHEVSAVLRRRGGRWNLIDSAIGATDVWYEDLVPKGTFADCG
jgi:hypothetical protein